MEVVALRSCYGRGHGAFVRGLVMPWMIRVGIMSAIERLSALMGCVPSVKSWGFLYVSTYGLLLPLRSPSADS